jgi:ABC-2 type transport system permease protein
MLYLYHRDKEIVGNIKNGNIAYELVRPQNLYAMWFSRILGDKLSSVVLRFLPVLVIASFLPADYRLDLSITLERFIIFIPAFILAALLIVSFIVLMHVIIMFTLDDRGVIVIFVTIADILAGTEIPLPFFPKFMQNISNVLPFRYMTDFPFRFYVGDIGISEGLQSILVQLVWIIILVVLGKLLMRKALKNAVVQGG